MTTPDGAGLVVAAPLRLEAMAVRRGLPPDVVVRTGMGPARSRRALTALRARKPAALAVAGVCGALTDDLAAGDVVVATEVRSVDRVITCPSAPLLAAALRAVGLTTHIGPIVSVDHVVHGKERADLAASGALAVDMESAVLAEAADGGPLAVLRVVVDTPSEPLFGPATVGNGRTALAVLARLGPVLLDWAAAVADRHVLLAGEADGMRAVADAAELVLVVGSTNSSDSRRLVEVARRDGVPAYLVDDVGEVELGWLTGVRTIGVSAGASAPPELVTELVAAIGGLGRLDIEERSVTTETVRFTLPKEVRH